MTFSPVIPLSGGAGWALLQRVEDTQRQVFSNRSDLARETAYFRENVSRMVEPADLVADRRVLEVALTAFGLEEEIGKGAFVQRVLESDLSDPGSFVNRLVDRRYREFAEAFGYGSILGPRILEPDFAERVVESYNDRRFEIAVGESDPALRLALNARRELARLASAGGAEDAGWFAVLGDLPLREVVEGALGLPSEFAQLDVDLQNQEIGDRMRASFGVESLADLSDPAILDDVVRRYVIRDASQNGATAITPGSTALTLLSGGLGGGAAQSLILSSA
ncbi:MAG: DUF1217 domain-containing protein [Pseudomonadota bacterium]